MDAQDYALGNGRGATPAAVDAAHEDALECRTCGGDARECGHFNAYNVRACERLGIDLASDAFRAASSDDERTAAARCPGCGLVMSRREAAEQGACNSCNGGAADLGASSDR